MLMPIGIYVRQGQRIIRRIRSNPVASRVVRCGGFFLGGFFSSAASLAHTPMPLSMGLLCAGICGWDALSLALGSALGSVLFWGTAGIPGLAWAGLGLVLSTVIRFARLPQRFAALMPGLAGLGVAVTGVILGLRGVNLPHFGLFCLQIAMAIGSALVFRVSFNRREPVADWLACGLTVLALSQVALFPGFSLGLVAVGMLCVAAPFPALALAGLAVDLSGICAAPITAVACLAFFLRMIPRLSRWFIHLSAPAIYLAVAMICGVWDMAPLFPLLAGGLCGIFLPAQTPISHRRGQTGVAQVRLELAAEVLAQTEQLLLEVKDTPIDEGALVVKAAERACITCPCRKTCAEREQALMLTPSLLHKPLVSPEDIPLNCRKRGRLLQELRRVQEQLRAIRADRDRQREYRSAMVQQYGFLSEYLQNLSDQLQDRTENRQPRFAPEIRAASAGLEAANGDRCMWFAGPGNQYFVLLCDGMGTGTGAEEESRSAANMLRRLLMAGYPAEHALHSLNSLCALRSRAGAVTVDLAQIDLQSGNAAIYKWGGAPSYLLSRQRTEKIGTAVPPPGLSVTCSLESVEKLSLRRGQTLVLLSDGIDGEAAVRHCEDWAKLPTGELAAKLLQYGRTQDDATAAVIRLQPWPSST